MGGDYIDSMANGNRLGYRWSEPFYNQKNFFDLPKDIKNEIKNHSTFLIGIFKEWHDGNTTIPPSKIDSLCFSNISINIAKEVFPIGSKLSNLKSYYDMIISHLECREYEEYEIANDNLYKIIELQDFYNKKIKCFFIIYRNYINKVINRPVDDNILRFYLHSIIRDIYYLLKDS